jgi:hypothetical protein
VRNRFLTLAPKQQHPDHGAPEKPKRQIVPSERGHKQALRKPKLVLADSNALRFRPMTTYMTANIIHENATSACSLSSVLRFDAFLFSGSFRSNTLFILRRKPLIADFFR